MTKPILTLALTASMLAGLSSPAQARDRESNWYRYEEYHHEADDDDDDDDRPRYRRSYYEDREYYRPRYDERRRYYRSERRHRCGGSGTTGLVLGGAVGALLGRSVDRYGDRAPGTIIGAGAGALLGRELERKSGC